MNIRQKVLPVAVLCALSWTVSSCLEDIDLDTGEQILNMYCVLGSGPEQELELSYMAPVGGTSRPVGEEVTVSLYDGDAPAGQFTRVSETRWNLAYSPQGGHKYRLEVKVPGEDVLTAETKFPIAGTLRYVLVQEVEKVKGLEPMYGGGPITTGYGFELDSPEDQVLWCCFEPVETVDGSSLPAYVDYIATDHPGVDGRGETILPYDPDSPILQDYIHDGYKYHQAGSVLSKDFLGGPVFLHEKLIRIVHPAGFGRPVQDGKLNVFRFDDDILISPWIPEDGTSGMFGISGVSEALVFAVLVISSVSPEYDAYLADYYYGRQDTDDFSVLVYKRNHYSNIRNGAGIFGAVCEYRVGNFNFCGVPYQFLDR